MNFLSFIQLIQLLANLNQCIYHNCVLQCQPMTWMLVGFTLITLTFCVPIHAPQVLDDAPCKKSQIITVGILEIFIVYCMFVVSNFPIVAMLSLDVPQAPYVPKPQPLKINGNLSIVFLKL